MITAREALLKAADLIEEHGHRRYAYGNPAEGFCAAGAIWWALAGSPRGPLSHITAWNAPFIQAINMLPQAGALAAWNDNPRTTKEDVIRTFREVAAS